MLGKQPHAGRLLLLASICEPVDGIPPLGGPNLSLFEIMISRQSSHSAARSAITTGPVEQPVRSPRLSSAPTHILVDCIGLGPLRLAGGYNFLSAALFHVSITHNATCDEDASAGNKSRHLNAKTRQSEHQLSLHLSNAIQTNTPNTAASPIMSMGSADAGPIRPFHALILAGTSVAI